MNKEDSSEICNDGATIKTAQSEEAQIIKVTK
jgi:hypothetical protein